MLIHPYQEQVKQKLIDDADSIMTLNREELYSFKKWKYELINWLKFLRQDCSQVSNILICLHKADLVRENLNEIAEKYPYSRNGGNPWYQFDQMVRNEFFGEVKAEIAKYENPKQPFQFFVTSVKNRSLLERPWLYISPYILYS